MDAPATFRAPSYAHLDRDLSGPKTGTNGRHPLPDGACTRRHVRPSGHRQRQAGRRLRSGQRHVREPSVVAAALAGARRGRRARRRLREMDGGRTRAVRPAPRNPHAARLHRGATAGHDRRRRRGASGHRGRGRARWSTRARRNAIAGRANRSTRSPDTFPARSIISSSGISTTTARFARPKTARATRATSIGDSAARADRLLLRIGRDRVPQPAGARARRAAGAKLYPRIVERMVERPVPACRTVTADGSAERRRRVSNCRSRHCRPDA